ncbi:M20/M25/M40 family metallo-hydrolase, partial [Chloroflexota bacterium]
YLVEKHPDKLKADFAINEGAVAPVIIGGRTCHFIQTGEKGPAWIRLKTGGIAAHGSLPGLGDNAVIKMALAIKKLADYRPAVQLIPEVKQLMQTIARLQGFGGEIDEGGVDRVIDTLADKTLAAYLTAITRITISPNEIQGGVKTNIVPDSCEAQLDIRILPGQEEEGLMKELARITGEAGMEMMQFSAPTFSTADSAHYKLIRDNLKGFVGEDEVLPCISSGATDSRFLREAGTPSYGIDMMTLNPGTAIARTVHGKDERIDIASLRLKAAFLEQLAVKYLCN